MAGLTSGGLVIKRLADIVADLEAAFKATFGPATRVGPDSVNGQLIGVIAIELAQAWELAQQLYDAFDPDQAEGVMLENLGALVGVSRNGATRSFGTVTITGTPGTVIPINSLVEASGSGARFYLIAEATIAGGGTVDATVYGELTGPYEASATAIDTIVTPVTGWDSVTNAADITPGQNQETIEEFRVRREESLQITGAAVDLAIRSAIRAIDGVDQCLVISNRTSVDPDANGIPAHSFETIIWPNLGDPAFDITLAETIFRLQPAGIQAFGDSTFDVTDSQGYTQQVAFSYATEIQMYALAELTVNANYPDDGDAQVAAALLAEGDLLSVGDDVKIWKFIAALDDIPGIDDITIKIENVDPPTNTANIAVAFSSVATFDSARITVTS